MRTRSSTVIQRRLACDSAAPRLARAELAQVALSQSARADATLVVSELVTNAVRHSGCDCDDEIELRVARTPDGVLISVRDVGRSPTEPTVSERSPDPGGLGLQLVAAVCAQWGAEQADGRLVWARIAA